MLLFFSCVNLLFDLLSPGEVPKPCEPTTEDTPRNTRQQSFLSSKSSVFLKLEIVCLLLVPLLFRKINKRMKFFDDEFSHKEERMGKKTRKKNHVQLRTEL